MATVLQLQGHVNISSLTPIPLIQSLSGRFPAFCLLLHNRSISGKVYTLKLDFVDETVANESFHKKDILFKVISQVLRGEKYWTISRPNILHISAPLCTDRRPNVFVNIIGSFTVVEISDIYTCCLTGLENFFCSYNEQGLITNPS